MACDHEQLLSNSIFKPPRFDLATFTIGLGLLTLTSIAQATPTALFISAGQLHRLDLESSTFSHPLPTQLTGRVRALTRNDQGQIYALTETCCPTRQHLNIIDPHSGSARRLGTLDQAKAWIGGLAVDRGESDREQERLWLAADGGLWSIDLTHGGFEKRLPLFIGEDQLLSIAMHGGQRFGIIARPSTTHPSKWREPKLIRILDHGTDWQPVADLSPINVDSLASFGVDANGRFWGLEITYAPGAPANIRHTFWRFDLDSGGMLSSATVDGSEIGLHFQAFALQNAIDSTATVPTLDTLGLILLGLLLAGTAQFLSWRRQQGLHI